MSASHIQTSTFTHRGAASHAPERDATTHAASRAAARADAPRSGNTLLSHLAITDVSHAFGDRRVLSGLSFTARAGDRIGLIAENGTGKSTLLRIVAGELEPDAGTVSRPGSVGLLVQELPYPGHTTMSTVLDDAQRGALDVLSRIESLGRALAEQPHEPRIVEAYADALQDAERSGAWQAEATRGDTLHGLGLGGFSPGRPIAELSGGQRLRLALAALLLEAPHTLLLDEPSNHLDDAAAGYLERVLLEWPGIVIVASHDRAMLDAVTTQILDLDPQPVPAGVLADAAQPAALTALTSEQLPALGDRTTDDTGSGLGARLWGVGYSAARAERQAEMRRWQERYEAELKERTALLHEIEVGSKEVNRKHESKSEAKISRKFYADKDARVTSRRGRNARVRLQTLERERVRRPPEPLRFTGLGDPEPHADTTAIRADEVAIAGRLATTSVSVGHRGRLMLAGPNGSGKSTLLAILAGALEPEAGSVDRGVRLGYLPQEVAFEHPHRSVIEYYRGAVGPDLADERPLSATGLIAARDQDRPVAALSVGQRRRLALATLVADPPPLLLLDEPTNHLSLTLVEQLEEALQAFSGALIIATHDRWLRSRWAGEVMTVEAPESSA